MWGAHQGHGVEKLGCQRRGAGWQGVPAQRAVGWRAGLPHVPLASARAATSVSGQDSCRAGSAPWWPTATLPGSRGPGKRSSANLAF